MTPLEYEAMKFAVFMHGNQIYGAFPYIVHLSDVVKNLRLYHYDDEEILAAGWLHDTMEDCHVSKDQLYSLFGNKVTSLVTSVTGIGSNRVERKMDMISKLKLYSKAIPLKMADRLANIENCQKFNPRMLEMYKKEFSDYDELFESANSEMNRVIRGILLS